MTPFRFARILLKWGSLSSLESENIWDFLKKVQGSFNKCCCIFWHNQWNTTAQGTLWSRYLLSNVFLLVSWCPIDVQIKIVGQNCFCHLYLCQKWPWWASLRTVLSGGRLFISRSTLKRNFATDCKTQGHFSAATSAAMSAITVFFTSSVIHRSCPFGCWWQDVERLLELEDHWQPIHVE